MSRETTPTAPIRSTRPLPPPPPLPWYARQEMRRLVLVALVVGNLIAGGLLGYLIHR